LGQLSRDEYFDQDIIERIFQATWVIEIEKADPPIWRDGCLGISILDVLHDSVVEIRRLREELQAAIGKAPAPGQSATAEMLKKLTPISPDGRVSIRFGDPDEDEMGRTKD
jgi:hypothetical protein